MIKKYPHTVIDLFSGCGGLSLGLEKAGFTPIFVSELNEHALSSYLINREHLNLNREQDTCNDIKEVTASPKKLNAFADRIQKKHGDVTLVTGGPPCQGYSARGIRSTFSKFQKQDIPSNYLYKDMAKIISAVGPKFFLFENVAGLKTARWTKSGSSGEVFSDILKEISSIKTRRNGRLVGYRTEWSIIKAKDYGVPQNRPRLLLLGVRDDIEINENLSSTAEGFLPDPLKTPPPDLIDLLGDLIDLRGEKNGVTTIYPRDAATKIQRDLRRKPKTNQALKKGAPLAEQEYTRHSETVTARFKLLISDPDSLTENMKIKKFSQRALPKRWGKNGPSITATSAPDDYVHFSRPRILTVREWARLQLFPDWYRFCGPRTTGGRRRAGDPSEGIWDRELPKYTQIGNAVPVRLAQAIVEHLIAMLEK